MTRLDLQRLLDGKRAMTKRVARCMAEILLDCLDESGDAASEAAWGPDKALAYRTGRMVVRAKIFLRELPKEETTP